MNFKTFLCHLYQEMWALDGPGELLQIVLREAVQAGRPVPQVPGEHKPVLGPPEASLEDGPGGLLRDGPLSLHFPVRNVSEITRQKTGGQ